MNQVSRTFIKAYDNIISCEHLSIWDRLIMSLAISYGESGSTLFASQQTIADRLGTSRDTVKRAISRIKRLPFVTVESRGEGMTLRVSVDIDAMDEWLSTLVQDAPPTLAQDAPPLVQDAPLLDHLENQYSLKNQFVLHGTFQRVKSACDATASKVDDSCSQSDGAEPSKDGLAEKGSKEGLLLVDELGSGFQRCRQMVELMTKLRRDEGLDQLIIGRMPIEQWERCENSLDAIFNERAREVHLERHILDMVTGPLAKTKKVNLHKLACTHALDSDFDHEHLILHCYEFDNAGYAC